MFSWLEIWIDRRTVWLLYSRENYVCRGYNYFFVFFVCVFFYIFQQYFKTVPFCLDWQEPQQVWPTLHWSETWMIIVNVLWWVSLETQKWEHKSIVCRCRTTQFYSHEKNGSTVNLTPQDNINKASCKPSLQNLLRFEYNIHDWTWKTIPYKQDLAITTLTCHTVTLNYITHAYTLEL